MVLETLETRGHVGGGAVSPPGPPRGPYPANGPGVPMTGPGWRENGRERTGADGIPARDELRVMMRELAAQQGAGRFPGKM